VNELRLRLPEQQGGARYRALRLARMYTSSKIQLIGRALRGCSGKSGPRTAVYPNLLGPRKFKAQ